MDRPVLHPLVRELAESERFRAFREQLPDTRARVSEPALPLAGRRALRGARQTARRPHARGRRRARPRRGGRLVPRRRAGCAPPEPRRQLGLRARAAAAPRRRAGPCARRARRGRASSARPRPRSPRRCRRRRRGPSRSASRPATSRGSRRSRSSSLSRATSESTRPRSAASSRCAAGSSTSTRRPGREPLRIELFGDEIESIRAFSPFTQRTLHPVDAATIYPAAERRLDLVEVRLADDGGRRRHRSPATSCRRSRPGPDFVWQPGEVREVWAEEQLEPVPLDDAVELDPLPAGQPFAFEAQRPGDRSARARRGRERAPSARPRRPPNCRRLPAPGRGAAHPEPPAPGRGPRRRPPARSFRTRPSSCSRSARLGVASSGATSGSPCCRTRRSSAAARAAAPHRPDGRSSRSPSCAPATTSSTRTTASGQLLGFETREIAGITRDYLQLAFRGEDRLYVPHEQIGKVSRYVGVDGKPPALSKLGGKAWNHAQEPCPGRHPRARRRAAPALRAAPERDRRSPSTSRRTGSSGSRPRSPTARPPTRPPRSRP